MAFTVVLVPKSALTLLHAHPRRVAVVLLAPVTQKNSLKLTLNIPTIPVQPLPHRGYQPYNAPYNPAAVAYNNDQGGEDEEEDEEGEEEQDPYYRGYPPQYYPQQPSQQARGHHGYHSSPTHSEDMELRSPGVARRFPRDTVVVMEKSEEGGL